MSDEGVRITITKAMADAYLNSDKLSSKAAELGNRHENLMGIASNDPLSRHFTECFATGARQAIAAANQALKRITDPIDRSEVFRHFTDLEASKEQLREWDVIVSGGHPDSWARIQESRLWSAGWTHGKQLAWSAVYGMLAIYQRVEAAAKCIIETALSVKISENLVLEILADGTWEATSINGRYGVMFDTKTYGFCVTDHHTDVCRDGRVHGFGLGNEHIILDPPHQTA